MGDVRSLDDFLAVYEFSERHELEVRAERDAVDRALRSVSLEEIPGVLVLYRLRGLGRPRTADEFYAYDRPDACNAEIDFRIAELGPGRCLLSTETRVHVEEPANRRAFRRYWLFVRPFSGLTRILFLRAVRRRAET